MSFLSNLKDIISTGTALAVNPVLGRIIGVTLDAILQAEIISPSGLDKKAIVLESVLATAKLYHIELDIEQLSALVDNLVEALNKPTK